MKDDLERYRRLVAAGDTLAHRRASLEQRRSVSFFKAVLTRYSDVDGGTAASLLSLQLFTTVLPLIILGYGYFNGFAQDVSVGVLFERELDLHGSLVQTVRGAFGSADGLRSSWSFIGVAGFLVWGIPMTSLVATLFARTWNRAPLPFRQRLWRGVLWFALYLITLALHDQIAFGGDHSGWRAMLLFLASLVPVWVFWTFTPALLIREGAMGPRFLAVAGLAGLIINSVVLSAVLRLLFPTILAGWAGFGGIGVAMAIMSWCGVLGIGWVATACVSAVLWERSAPESTVLAAEAPPEPSGGSDEQPGAGNGEGRPSAGRKTV